MIIAGPCSYISDKDTSDIVVTATALRGIADIFRVKCVLGGTSVDRYVRGIEEEGIDILQEINDNILPVMTEIHISAHIVWFRKLHGLWIGARNSSNYTLLESFKHFHGEKYIKRGPGATIQETMNLYDICDKIHGYKPYIIERGTNYLSRDDQVRWSISINDILKIKVSRADIFDRLVVDCSHSAGVKEYVKDIYRAHKAIGVKHFMIEATLDGESKTDANQMLSVDELKEMLK